MSEKERVMEGFSYQTYRYKFVLFEILL